ncbi:hypothetical protein C8J57DRAFT_1479747 [Mycena rebaudengoi]|nr:hypothetical protein C8J57DRAFT_1479747 [Mycena rebaudengoi]
MSIKGQELGDFFFAVIDICRCLKHISLEFYGTQNFCYLRHCGKPPMFRELARAGHSMSHVTHRGPLPLLSTENGPITGVLDPQLIPKCIVCFPVKFGLAGSRNSLQVDLE